MDSLNLKLDSLPLNRMKLGKTSDQHSGAILFIYLLYPVCLMLFVSAKYTYIHMVLQHVYIYIYIYMQHIQLLFFGSQMPNLFGVYQRRVRWLPFRNIRLLGFKWRDLLTDFPQEAILPSSLGWPQTD